jgi:predicted DNA-binding transcriptional regulator AlpA
MAQPDTTPAIAAPDLLDLEQVCAFFGGTKPLNPATIYRGLGKLYPKPIKVGANTNRWLRSDCEAALQKLIDASRAA